MTDDDAIKNSAVGWRYSLALAALTKGLLADPELPTEWRVQFLELLEKIEMTKAVAHVQPACARAFEISAEIRKSCRPWDGAGASDYLDALGSVAIYSEFAKLNPSLISGLALCNQR